MRTLFFALVMICSITFNQKLFAELDPELAQTQKHSKSFIDVGANIGIGMFSFSEKSSSNIFYLLSLEGDYLFRNLGTEYMELGLELGFANANSKKDDESLSQFVFPFIVPKIGFFNSFNNNVYGILSIGLGTALTNYSKKIDGQKYNSDSVMGLIIKLSYKLKINTQNSRFKFIIGPEWLYSIANFNKIKKDSTIISDITTLRLNALHLVFGGQFSL